MTSHQCSAPSLLNSHPFAEREPRPSLVLFHLRRSLATGISCVSMTLINYLIKNESPLAIVPPDTSRQLKLHIRNRPDHREKKRSRSVFSSHCRDTDGSHLASFEGLIIITNGKATYALSNLVTVQNCVNKKGLPGTRCCQQSSGCLRHLERYHSLKVAVAR